MEDCFSGLESARTHSGAQGRRAQSISSRASCLDWFGWRATTPRAAQRPVCHATRPTGHSTVRRVPWSRTRGAGARGPQATRTQSSKAVGGGARGSHTVSQSDHARQRPPTTTAPTPCHGTRALCRHSTATNNAAPLSARSARLGWSPVLTSEGRWRGLAELGSYPVAWRSNSLIGARFTHSSGVLQGTVQAELLLLQMSRAKRRKTLLPGMPLQIFGPKSLLGQKSPFDNSSGLQVASDRHPGGSSATKRRARALCVFPVFTASRPPVHHTLHFDCWKETAYHE